MTFFPSSLVFLSLALILRGACCTTARTRLAARIDACSALGAASLAFGTRLAASATAGARHPLRIQARGTILAAPLPSHASATAGARHPLRIQARPAAVAAALFGAPCAAYTAAWARDPIGLESSPTVAAASLLLHASSAAGARYPSSLQAGSALVTAAAFSCVLCVARTNTRDTVCVSSKILLTAVLDIFHDVT